MRVLVTGAAGFMGSWVTRRLLDLGFDVYGIDDLSGGFVENVPSQCKFHVIDLSDRITELIREISPSIVFHLAASAREGASQFEPVHSTRTNYWAYLNLLENCIKTKKLSKVVLFSSMAVYGAQTPPFSEDLTPKPEDIYGINKFAMEESTKILAKVHNFGYTIIRPHNVFGEYQCLSDPFRNVVAIFMNRIMRNEPIYIYGDGNQKRAFSYILDSIDCYIKCMRRDLDGDIFNIGSDLEITVNELKDLVLSEFTEYPIPKIIHLPDRPQEVKLAWCSHEKAKRILDFKESIGLKEGIKRMAKWAKQKGPQEWRYDTLALVNEKTPSIWKEKK